MKVKTVFNIDSRLLKAYPDALEARKREAAASFGLEASKHLAFTEEPSPPGVNSFEMTGHVYSDETMSEVFKLLKNNESRSPEIARIAELLSK